LSEFETLGVARERERESGFEGGERDREVRVSGVLLCALVGDEDGFIFLIIFFSNFAYDGVLF
jgi:hypothetical protein